MRRVMLSLVVVCFLLLASAAKATLTFTLETSTSRGVALDSLWVGDVVTIDITLRNDDELIRVLQASAVGYDPAVLSFRSGTAVNSVLSRACVPASTGFDCFDGIYHDRGGILHPSNISLSEEASHPLGPFVRFFSGSAGLPFSSTGELDIGVDGLEGGPQFQLIYEVVSAGRTILDLGIHTDYQDLSGGPRELPSQREILSLTVVVPEPGTGMLVGLGLIGLGARRAEGGGSRASCLRSHARLS